MNNHKPRMTAFNFPKWDKYDDNKNDVKRIDYIRGYFKDDPRAVVVLTLEKKKITWDEARINPFSAASIMLDIPTVYKKYFTRYH